MPDVSDPAGREAELDLLLVEDNPGDVDLVREQLQPGGITGRLRVWGTRSEATSALRDGPHDAVLPDLNLPHSRGIATLDAIMEAAVGVPVIVLTGPSDGEAGSAAMRRGAHDFLLEDEITGPVLRRSIRHAIERHEHELRVRDGERRAQRYLEIADVILVALDRDGRIETINPAGARILGYDAPSTLEGRS